MIGVVFNKELLFSVDGFAATIWLQWIKFCGTKHPETIHDLRNEIMVPIEAIENNKNIQVFWKIVSIGWATTRPAVADMWMTWWCSLIKRNFDAFLDIFYVNVIIAYCWEVCKCYNDRFRMTCCVDLDMSVCLSAYTQTNP